MRSFAMNAYVILTLLIMGHLCQVQAATLSGPPMTTDDAKQLLTEELSRYIMDHRGDLIEALKGIKGAADETNEHIHRVVVSVSKKIVERVADATIGFVVNKLLGHLLDRPTEPSF
ncbi:hypothetical protein MRX96_004176 [Rhipicephalus microplus]